MTKARNDGSRAHAAEAPPRLAQRAHDIYLARGGADGMGLDGWLQTEAEVGAGLAPSPVWGEGIARPRARRDRGGKR